MFLFCFFSAFVSVHLLSKVLLSLEISGLIKSGILRKSKFLLRLYFLQHCLFQRDLDKNLKSKGQSFWNGVHFLSSHGNVPQTCNPQPNQKLRGFAMSKHIGAHQTGSQTGRIPEESDEDDSVDGPDQGLTKALALDCEMVRVNHVHK